MVGILKNIFGVRRESGVEHRIVFKPGELVRYATGEYGQVMSLEEYKIRHDLYPREETNVKKGKMVCFEGTSGYTSILYSRYLVRVDPNKAIEDIAQLYQERVDTADKKQKLLNEEKMRDQAEMERDVAFIRAYTSTK